MSKISLTIQEKTRRPLLLIQTNDSGIIIRTFLSVIFEKYQLEEINKTLSEAKEGMGWKKKPGYENANIEETLGKKGLIKKLELKEIDSAFVSSIENKYYIIKKVVWK